MNCQKGKIKCASTDGFTLVELLIVLAIIFIIALIVIAAINPFEQANRAKDLANEANAKSLLTAIERYQATNEGENPDIKTVSDSYDCSDIVEGGPVYDIKPLENEVPDWFIKHVFDEGSELYVGFIRTATKVCFQVKSTRSIGEIPEKGCNTGYLYYHCLPY
jgi:type II secretory pathway pseudopilin PulG